MERVIAGLVALLLARLALAAGRAAQRRFSVPVDPLSLFLWLWAGALALFAAPVIYYTPSPATVWGLTYGSIAFFAAGCLLVYDLDRRRNGAVSTIEPLTPPPVSNVRLRLVWLAVGVLGLVGFAAFLRAGAEIVGLRTAILNPAQLRAERISGPAFDAAYGPAKVLTYFNQVAFVVWTIGLRTRAFSRRWRWARAVGLVSLLPFVFTADRGNMAATLAWAGVLHVLWGPLDVRRFRRYAPLALAGALAIFLALGARYGSSLESQPQIQARVLMNLPDQAVMGYLYITANLPTFGQLTEDPIAPVTYGQMTALPVVKAVDAAGLAGTPPFPTGVFYPIPFEAFSNYGWLGTFWLDLRAPGVLLLPLAFALLTAGVFLKTLRTRSFGWIWLLSLLLMVVAFSPLTNQLSTTFTWEHAALGPLIALAVSREPGGIAKMRSYVDRRRLAAAGLAGVLASIAVIGADLRRGKSAADPGVGAADIKRTLRAGAVDAHVAYQTEGAYPGVQALVSRLKAARPEIEYRPLASAVDVVPAAPAVGVFSTPDELMFRTHDRVGRVFELRRSERGGGHTFGPGTRDAP